MGLKVWLPLNGDLHNQGYSNIDITNSNCTVNDAGKIGKCYYFNGSSYLSAPSPENIKSVCFWLKTTVAASKVAFVDYKSKLGFGFNANKYMIVSSDSWNIKMYTNFSAIVDNQWTHITIIKTDDGNDVLLYINGILQTARGSTNNWTHTTDTLMIGKRSSGTNMTCYINDFRAYDHCLSAAEVREISQGLVLHYKLNDAPILCKTNLTTWTKESGVTSTAQDDGSVKIDCTAKTSSRWGIYCDIQNILPNTPYTFSIDCKTAHVDKKWQLSVGCNPVPSGTSQFGSNRATMNSTSGFTTYTATVTTNANTTWIRFYLALSCSSTTPEYQYAFVKNVKMTIGTSLQTTIQDSSGYSHHGTVTGIIEAQTDTKRYNKSAYVNGSSYILTPASSFAWNDLTQLTFSAWMKPTASMTGWRGSVGIAADSNQTARGIAITDYGNEFRGTYTNGSGYQTVATGKTLTQNEWHHCAGTLNGTEFKLYFDGVLVKTQTIDWGTATLNANARFEVGVDLPGTDEKFTGNYSDVRCYCTTLDADAIRQLYEVGAKVDNKQNLHTFELIETNKQEITKQGQIKGQNLLETYLPLYDKNIYTEPDGSTWIHIFHHNNPANSKFNETTLDWTTGKYLDTDRWYDVDQAIYYTLSPYEFMVKQKTTSSAAETKYRWVQTVNPLTAVWADVKPGTVTFNTSSGYTSSSHGGMYLLKSSSLHMCIANSNSGNWYGGIGVATAYSGGIPGYPNTTVTTGYVDLYMRVYNGTKIIKNVGISSTEFIEL